jgi:hypothetical protein
MGYLKDSAQMKGELFAGGGLSGIDCMPFETWTGL